MATIAVFIAAGLGLAAWVVSIPGVEHRVGLSHPMLGTFLLLLGLGSFLGMSAAGPWVDRRGSSSVVLPGAAGASLGLAIIAVAHEPWQLAAGLLVFGLGHGVMDVAMNDQAVLVQRAYGRPIMSNFHAFFSVGAGAGSLLGAAVQAAGVDVVWVLLGGAVLGLAVVLWARPRLLPAGAVVVAEAADAAAGLGAAVPAAGAAGATGVPGAAGTSSGSAVSSQTASDSARSAVAAAPTRAPRKGLPPYALLAVLAFLLMLAEGVANDWSSLHAVDQLGQSAAGGALAYAAFAVAMVAGRFAADAVVARVGGVAVVRFGSVIAAAGLLIVVLSPVFGLTLLGWALFGLGVSGIVPQIFTAAGELGGASQGKVMSRVVGAGYLGMLAGPAVIGWVSPWLGLGWALIIPVVCCLIGMLCAGKVRLPRSARQGVVGQ